MKTWKSECMQGRRAACVALAGALAFASGSVAAQAAPPEVKLAVVVPLSGPWARSGELHVKGAQLAVDDINAAGGIKALGGAKIRLLLVDAGDSVEKARSAAQRLLASEPDLTGATGSYLSSFTLAVTEMTERAELPFLTLSYSEQINDRGFNYVFQTSPSAMVQAETTLPILMRLAQSAGQTPKTVGVISDNTASPLAFAAPMRERGFKEHHLELKVDEIYTPPLSDATSMIQRLRSNRPDLAFVLATNVPDFKLLLEKMQEMRLGSGAIPVVSNGGYMGTPELLRVTSKESLEGIMVAIGNWVGRGHESIAQAFMERFQEPWMPQDSISTYGDMWIFKEAMEVAQSADRRKVAEAIRAMDTTEGAAKYFSGGGRLKFDEKGRRVGAETVILQWRDGKPLPVYPPNLAVTTPQWAKR